MPLDHIHGDHIEGMDSVRRVVPVEKYKALPGLTTLVEETTGKSFRRKQVVEKSIWNAAEDYAKIAFRNSGAPAGPLSYDVIAIEYPRTFVVAFLFAADIFGHEMLVPVPVELTPEQVAEMKVIGEWEDVTVN